MFKIRGLTCRGLAPFDFDLREGECAAVTGPSGAGKTVLLRAIADLDPNEGEVFLGETGRGSVQAPAWRRRVVYLATEPGWWADRVRDHYENPAAAEELLDRFGLPAGALDWEVARLSTGERQRLALARTLILSPEVLLLDEPTSGLDDDSTTAVENELRTRMSAGTSILLVSHDRAQAGRMASRTLRVEDGAVREEKS